MPMSFQYQSQTVPILLSHDVALILCVDESVTTQMKAIEQYFFMLLFLFFWVVFSKRFCFVLVGNYVIHEAYRIDVATSEKKKKQTHARTHTKIPVKFQ